MIELTPKKRFLANEEACRYLRSLVGNDIFHHALTSSMTELAMRQTTGADHLAGARAFLSILLNLAEIEQSPAQIPMHRVTLHPDTRKKTESPNPQRSD